TGLRVGIGTLRGLALAAGRPAVGVSTLAAMAGAMGAHGIRLAPILDAGRGEVYAAVYSGDDPPRLLGSEAVMPPSQLDAFLGAEPVLVFGPGVGRHRRSIEHSLAGGSRLIEWEAPLAAPAGRLALKLLDSGVLSHELPPTAVYIRRSDARLPGRA
ncbi:MAG: tRNA (adenosine(37)-N6)-threonylcarbamoyltransferase complex dimerization subunit type 1 TsaB, partial [Vicinamibacteria bacterium]